MTFDLTIAAPRSARWHELAETAFNRVDGATDWSEPQRLASTGRVAASVLALLRQLGRSAHTKEISARLGIGYTSALGACRVLRADGEVTRTERRTSGADGRVRAMWEAR